MISLNRVTAPLLCNLISINLDLKLWSTCVGADVDQTFSMNLRFVKLVGFLMAENMSIKDLFYTYVV